MKLWLLLHRVVLIALAALAGLWLESRFGLWKAVAAWSLGMLIACVIIAVLLSRQPVGSRNIINQLAGWLLPWGWRLTQGVLARMVAVSWLVWVMQGAAAAALAAVGEPAGQQNPSAALKALLYLAWVIHGWGALYLLGIMVSNRRVSPPLLLPTLILAGLVAASATIFFRAPSQGTLISALLVAGAPIALSSVGFGVFTCVLLIAGRKTNWR